MRQKEERSFGPKDEQIYTPVCCNRRWLSHAHQPLARQTERIVHDCRVDLARINRSQKLFRREIEQARREIEASVDLLRRIGAVLSRLEGSTNEPRPRR